jgi:hypothetical protein
VEGRGVAAGKTTAADLGAVICFEDESGQGLRPPRGRTWAPRGARPVVRVRGRVNIAGVLRFRPGQRPHLLYRMPDRDRPDHRIEVIPSHASTHTTWVSGCGLAGRTSRRLGSSKRRWRPVRWQSAFDRVMDGQ